MAKKFMGFGLSEPFLKLMCEHEIKEINEEPEEEQLLVTTIKSLTAETKASRDYNE